MKTNFKKFFAVMMLTLISGVAFAKTEVEIVVPDTYPVADGYVMTYVNFNYAIDFTDAEGIKAYAAKKKSDDYGSIEALILEPVFKIPAGTPVILKAEVAGSYRIPLTNEPEVFETDLQASAQDIDFYDVVTNKYGAFLTGPAVLAEGTYTDYNTYSQKTGVGFFPAIAARPAAAGTDFLPAGTVYLPITEADDWYWSAQYVALLFSDAPAPDVVEVNHIEEVLVLEPGTEFKLTLGDYPSVTYANEEFFVIEDTGKGIFVKAANSFQAGDILMGTISGVYSIEGGSFIDNADISGVSAPYNFGWEAEETTLGDAFVDYVQKLVKLTNLTVHTTQVTNDWGGTSIKRSIEDQDGTEVELNSILGGAIEAIESLNDGDIIEELQGYAVIVSEASALLQMGLIPSYFFDPTYIKVQQAPVGNYEVELAYDNSRLDNWQFPTEVKNGTEIKIPYTVESYGDDLNNVVVKLIVNGQEAGTQTVESIVTDEEMGEGSYSGLFTYTPTEEGVLAFKLTLTFDGAQETYETEVVNITVTTPTGIWAITGNKEKAPMYDLQGRRVTAPAKGGVYILEGKKVMVK